MKILKIVGKVFLGFLSLLVLAFFYFESDFYEIRRLKSQIEIHLDLNEIELPKLLYRENYGWAEEGGDISLMLLRPKDCEAISLLMTDSEIPNGKAKYLRVFAKNKVVPKFVKTRLEASPKGDIRYFALDEESCNFYRWYHYE